MNPDSRNGCNVDIASLYPFKIFWFRRFVAYGWPCNTQGIVLQFRSHLKYRVLNGWLSFLKAIACCSMSRSKTLSFYNLEVTACESNNLAWGIQSLVMKEIFLFCFLFSWGLGQSHCNRFSSVTIACIVLLWCNRILINVFFKHQVVVKE